MVLGQLQSLLSDIYALEMSYDVYDFLITDARLADELDAGGRCVDEKLLIAEEADAASVSLYLGQGLMERLRDEKSVFIVPGDHFEMDHYMRIGYGYDRDALETALGRCSELLDGLS